MTTATHSHIVPMARPFFILRIVQIVLAVFLLGILSYLAWDYNQNFGSFASTYSGAIGLGLFAVCLTLILGVYYLVSTLSVHNAYNKWAVVALEAAAVLFWLISFALIADSVAKNYAFENSVVCDAFGDCTNVSDEGDFAAWNGLWDTSLALSLIEWILFIVTLVLFSLGLHKHRANSPNVTQQSYTPKDMEAGPAPAQPVPVPEYQHQQHVPQPGYEQQPMQQHPVQDSTTPMH